MDVPGPEPSDEALAARSVAGDETAFEALVVRYQARAYRLAHRLVGAEGDAQDAVQEAFLQVFLKLATFRGEARLSTWLYRIVTNAALMQRRRRSRRPVEPLDACLPAFDANGQHLASPAEIAAASDVEARLDRRLLAEKARAGIDRLPEAYRAAFVLRDLEELDTAEVGTILGLEPAAVRQRVHRARLMLRGYLAGLVAVKA